MWFLVGRSQMRCGHRHAVCLCVTSLAESVLASWMNEKLLCPVTPDDFTYKSCAEEQPSSLPNLQSPSRKLRCIMIAISFFAQPQKKSSTMYNTAFQLLTKDIPEPAITLLWNRSSKKPKNTPELTILLCQ